jgi:hypothetical protein
MPEPPLTSLVSMTRSGINPYPSCQSFTIEVIDSGDNDEERGSHTCGNYEEKWLSLEWDMSPLRTFTALTTLAVSHCCIKPRNILLSNCVGEPQS